MQNSDKIGSRQFIILVTFITIGDSILILPSIPATEAGHDGWLSGLIGMILGLAIVYLFCVVARIYPEQTLIEKNELIFGRWLGTFFSLFFLGAILINGAVYIRTIGEFMTTHIMKQTPIDAVMFLLVACAIYAVRLGLEAFARTSEIFFLWFVLTFVMFFLLLSPQFQFENLFPFLENGIKPVIRGVFSVTAFPFSELVIFLMITPLLDAKQKLTSAFLRGAIYGGACLLAVIFLSLLVLGPELVSRETFPSYSLAKRIHVGEFFQRQEAMMALMWFVSIYFKVVLYMYGFCVGIKQLLHLKEHQSLTLPICILFVAIAIIIVPNGAFLYETYTYWPFFDLTNGFLYPLILIVGYWIRKRMNNKPATLQK
ncbi:endospore germination permease [Brevibacillus sp. BC25]|uniref:GerAB/ArcD/ProY family transporter n=1 Tax=Brevibacillus sp. BC25 TaxID=1144308 RepID=UPI0002714FA1|nr:endospore germination permease [Brevibacillus sp. BC25]EJL20394.1 spore germination protein, amino acid permease [Brevibacillus sp. BC25]